MTLKIRLFLISNAWEWQYMFDKSDKVLGNHKWNAVFTLQSNIPGIFSYMCITGSLWPYTELPVTAALLKRLSIHFLHLLHPVQVGLESIQR